EWHLSARPSGDRTSAAERWRSDSPWLRRRDVQDSAAGGFYRDRSSLTGSKLPNPPPDPKLQVRPVASMRARCAPLAPGTVATHNAYSSVVRVSDTFMPPPALK